MITLSGVKKVFNHDTIIALKNYTFEKNKSYCLLGPSGSGKSTLLNMIAGIVMPTEGCIRVGGMEINKMSQEELDRFRYKQVGYIPQDLKLLEEFTVIDNLKILGISGSLKVAPETVLGWVELKHKAKSKVKNLSGGEKQRAAIARALMKAPSIMLCDEPTGSLNFSKGLEIIRLLIKLYKENKSLLIVVTHDERLADLFDEIIKFEDLLADTKNGKKGSSV